MKNRISHIAYGVSFKRILIILAICYMPYAILGCAPLLIGAAVGGMGCYAVSKDIVQGETDKSYDSVWDAVVTVSKIRGTIKQEDSGRGYLVLAANGSKVWIRLVRLTRSTVRLRIQARRFHLPNLALAQDIYARIMEEAR